MKVKTIKDTPKDGRWYELPSMNGEHYISWDLSKKSWRNIVITSTGAKYGDYLPDGAEIYLKTY